MLVDGFVCLVVMWSGDRWFYYLETMLWWGFVADYKRVFKSVKLIQIYIFYTFFTLSFGIHYLLFLNFYPSFKKQNKNDVKNKSWIN